MGAGAAVGISIDYTISIGLIVQTAIVIAGGLLALGAMRSTVKTIQTAAAETKKEIWKQLDDVQAKLNELNKVLISLARFEERLSSLDTRVTTHGRKIDDLSRGDGYVKRPPRTALDGEYP